MPRRYPQTRKVDQVDDYHGTRVFDPYRWLEQPADEPEVRDWILEQNIYSNSWLEATGYRESLRKRLAELWDYPKAGPPFRRGERYFQFRNSGLQNQNVLYLLDHPSDEGRVLLDPNAFSSDGRTALVDVSVSPDGQLLAYALSEGGSDWNSWRFKRVATGEELPDLLEWVKFSEPTWHPDCSGVFYQRFPTPAAGERLQAVNRSPQLCFHALGSDQQTDEIVFERPDEPDWLFSATVSDDDRYLVVSVVRSTEVRNLLFYRPLDGGEFLPLIPRFSEQALFLGNDGETFYLHTNRGGGRGKIVSVELTQPEVWHDLVPEGEHLLESARLLGSEFLLVYQEHASHRIRRVSTAGEERGEVPLPGLGSVMVSSARREHDEAFLLFTSFLEPSTPYRLSLPEGSLERLAESSLDFDAGAYRIRQEFTTSPDGTRVPMFLVHRRDLRSDRDNPCLLYGYGGFNVSQTPVFSVSRLAWLERGGVLAVANLRGGGEYGREWHEAGILARKQNVFDDFIACAEWLVNEGITSSRRLAIQGGSNGGLLVAACLSQRPELFAAAHVNVGVLDMLRYHLFTIGAHWASDFGRADDPEQFDFLHAYSPLHNLSAGLCYPATLITTGDHDDRVVPAHSFKFAAALQEAQGCDVPVLLRVETRAGHGMGKPTRAVIEEQADVWSFLLHCLDASATERATPGFRGVTYDDNRLPD